jgi:hypothetical protein
MLFKKKNSHPFIKKKKRVYPSSSMSKSLQAYDKFIFLLLRRIQHGKTFKTALMLYFFLEHGTVDLNE